MSDITDDESDGGSTDHTGGGGGGGAKTGWKLFASKLIIARSLAEGMYLLVILSVTCG